MNLGSTLESSIMAHAIPLTNLSSNNEERVDIEENAGNKVKRKKVNAYFGSPERTVVTIYEGGSVSCALTGVVLIIIGVITKKPQLWGIGIALVVCGGSSTLLAHKYRQLRTLNEVTDDLVDENNNLRNELKNMKEENKRLDGDVIKFDNENKELKEDTDKLEDEIINIDKENDELKQTVDKLENTEVKFEVNLKSLSQHTDQLDTLQKKYQQIEQNHEKIVEREEIATETLEGLIKDKQIADEVSKIAPKVYEQAKKNLNIN